MQDLLMDIYFIYFLERILFHELYGFLMGCYHYDNTVMLSPEKHKRDHDI
jgi:hypothetical protein